MNIPSISTVKIIKISIDDCLEMEDALAIEEPLEISIRYGPGTEIINKIISVTMRTPGHDADLAAGFLFTENILHSHNQITAINALDENKILVTLNDEAQPFLQHADRNFYTTSSCGVCGKSSIGAIRTVSRYAGTNDDISFDKDILYALPSRLRAQQKVFQSTGGLHASAFFDDEGNFITLREDVGRHNALDKIIGYFFRQNELPLNRGILLLSGRASFELVQKAHMAGIKFIAAVGAPSSLAAELAVEAGITLVGFLGNERFNVYCGAHRINQIAK